MTDERAPDPDLVEVDQGDEVDEVDETEEVEQPSTTDVAPSRSTAWIAWTVAAALAVVAAVAIVQWQSVQQPSARAEAARDAAVDYVIALSNWDASTGLEPTYAALVAGATEEFVPEIDTVFGPGTRQGLVDIDAVSTSTVEDVLTGELEPGDGTAPAALDVIVVVEQFIVSGPTADPLSRSERVVLLRMVDGGTPGWLVGDLTMLSELQLVEEDAG